MQDLGIARMIGYIMRVFVADDMAVINKVKAS